jgi:hypothetical protein
MKRYFALIVLLAAFTAGNLFGEQFRVRLIPSSYAQGGGLNAGDIVIRVSGDCGSGFAEVSAANGRTILGTLSANGNQGGTGGNDNITPAGDVSQPTFSGNALSTHSHGTGTYAASAHAGAAVGDHASHTHTYTEVPNHVHAMMRFPTATGGSTGFTVDTSMSGTQATANDTANPTGGVATGTTAGPSATLTHSVTQPDAHTLSGSSEAVGAGTPAGTVSTPTFTGTQFDNRSAFLRVILCEKS